MSSTPHGANAPPQAAACQSDDSNSDSGENPSLPPPCDHHDHHLSGSELCGLSSSGLHFEADDNDRCLDDGGESPCDDDTSIEREVYGDIQMRIRGQSHTIIDRAKFFELTAYCDPDAGHNIYYIIKEYFSFLNSDHAFAQQQNAILWGLLPTEKKELGIKVHDHIAEGRVFIFSFQPSDRDMATIDSKVRTSISGNGTLVKISYATGPVDKHMSKLADECELQFPKLIASYPKKKQSPIGFVHLLEKVIQELYNAQQKDVYCHGCGKIHGDIFEFEAVGKCKCVESTRLHLDSMRHEVLKWVDFLSDLYPIYLSVTEIQNKMLDRINKKLSGTSTHAL
ncbi:hypothetical protein BGZ74_003994 [Mortierella antarctica]|nr:hypothetical protein BGZ74_003994 [Mortierella antarctica]